MRCLLIHQNFPGQFRSLAPYLHARGHELISICSHQRPVDLGFKVIRYDPPVLPELSLSLSQSTWFIGLQRAESVAHICYELNAQGWIPDRILAHSGWGETIALNIVWPDVPLILWPELWVHPYHGGYGVDPQLPPPGLSQSLEQLGRNALTRVAIDQATSWVMPTQHQALSLPPCYRDQRLHVIHEGIDTTTAVPNSSISFTLSGLKIDRSIPTVTFVNRNLERLRGFDQFMRSLPRLQKDWPNLRVIIVGDNDKGYGSLHPSGRPLREVMVEELSSVLQFDRIHFLGRIPYPQLIAILQSSWVHVYLSYPFVLGWSLLEAMACGCAIVASEGMPVEEVITNGVEGLLVPLDDCDTLTNRVSSLLASSRLRSELGAAARQKSLLYDQSTTLPRLISLVHNLS